MNNTKSLAIILFSVVISLSVAAQMPEGFKELTLGKQTFELHNVKGEIIKFQGTDVSNL